ncbi:MAG: COQ9 family protein [Rubritepida sp.]|nr:COQ9 family protein [Rubritepida sp.]
MRPHHIVMTEEETIDRLLPLVPRLGWTRLALAEAAGDAAMADNIFPRGPRDAVAAWSRLGDRRMAEAAGDLGALRVPARIRRLIEIRFEQAWPHKEALRGALAILATPWNAPLALRLTADTMSAMWYAAGDRSADFSWYTRRASLAAVYGATLVFWMRDASADLGRTLAFLDRRLADLHRLQRPRKAG